MDIDTLLHDSNANQLVDLLGFATETGRKRFLFQIRQTTDDPGTLSKRQNTIQDIRKSPNPLHKNLIDQVASLEPEISSFFQRTTLETESYEQLLFSSWEFLKVFNLIPFLLVAISILKIWLNPALVLLSPILMILGPYIVLRYYDKFHLPFSVYIQIVLKTIGVDFPLNPKQMLQTGLAVFSIGQSIYQTIQNSRHLYKIDLEIKRKGAALRNLGTCCAELLTSLGEKPERNPLADLPDDDRMVFAIGWDSPHRIQQALLLFGDFEVLYRIAQYQSLRRVHILQATEGKPSLRMRDAFDPFLPKETRKSYNLTLGHGILTGPNRGGKSSVLRSVLLNVILAQSIGYSFASRMEIRLFSWIASGLNLTDTPGKTSLFEREVEFATQIVKSAEKGKAGFVVFDEIFHSTNPPDGKRTASLFLDSIWKRANVTSFISTHVFELAEMAPKDVRRLCVPAYRSAQDELIFTHELKSGICKESSVDLILKEKGFFRKRAVSLQKEKALTGREHNERTE
jgi:hypothetical protein